MSRALFYHPPIANIPLLTVPLAFLHLATALRGTEHTLELIDGRVESDPVGTLLRRIGRGDVDAMLISAMPGSQIASALEAARAARGAAPDLPIIWGGAHPSVDPERTIASPYASAVVVGRGEFTIADVLAACRDPRALARIPNVLAKDETGTVLRGPREVFSTRAPSAPDFALLGDIEPYVCQTRRSRRVLDYISSFGCPHVCTFCSEPVTSGSRWSPLDADVLVEEVRALQARYDLDGILFQDAKFVTNRKRLIRFCRNLLETGTKVNWIATACSTDIPHMHESGTLALMRDAGCEQLFIGAEAASGETLALYRKTVVGEETYRIAKLLWEEYDILPHFSYVLSYPIESMEQVDKTLFLHQSICEIVQAPTGELGIYNPVPQTAFLAAYEDRFDLPAALDGWSDFDYFAQKLYKEPSDDLKRMLFRHHVKIRRMFPNVESYRTFDVWQEQYHRAGA